MSSLNLSDQAIQEIRSSWTNTLSANAQFSLIKQSENHTYLVTDDDNSNGRSSSSLKFVLRMTPSTHRSKAAIQAEIDYIRIIEQQLLLEKNSGNGVENDSTVVRRRRRREKLCLPIAFSSADEKDGADGEFVASIRDPYRGEEEEENEEKKKSSESEEWYAVLFEHAHGTIATDKWIGLTDDSLIDALGHTLGTFHRAIHRVKSQEEGSNSNTNETNSTAVDQRAIEQWRALKALVPQCDETHSGATNIERIRSRAQVNKHYPSQLLLNVWDQKLEAFLNKLKNDARSQNMFSIIHGDLNVSNYCAELATTTDEKPKLWLFDFDQLHHNYYGFDVAVVLHTVRFFEEDGLGIGPIEGFDANRFRHLFLKAYGDAFPAMVEAGHLQPDILQGFELYRHYYHTAVAVDILFQAENGKKFEESITGFCKIVVDKFQQKYC